MPHHQREKFHPAYLCLALPFIAHVLVPTYNRIDPTLFGIPFFFWYQMAWIPCTALAILPAYLLEERRRK